MSQLHVWTTPFEKKVVDEVHHYAALPTTSTLYSRQGLGATVFTQPLKQAAPELRGVIGRTQRTDWFSPSAENLVKPAADLAFCQRLTEHACWDNLNDGWLSALGNGDRLLLRPQKATGDWLFSLGNDGSVVLGVACR